MTKITFQPNAFKGEPGIKKIDGYLFAKLNHIGSKSEGPAYFLQQFDYTELAIVKQVNLWEADPALHPLIAGKVTLLGEVHPDGIVYEQVFPYVNDVSDNLQKLQVALELRDGIVFIDDLPDRAAQQSLSLTLTVIWPYRSSWSGQCPTSQLHDFWIEHEGKTIWRWSEGQVFQEIITPVRIPGGSQHKFTEVWPINTAAIHQEGVYTANAVHIASGIAVSETFKIKFTR